MKRGVHASDRPVIRGVMNIMQTRIQIRCTTIMVLRAAAAARIAPNDCRIQEEADRARTMALGSKRKIVLLIFIPFLSFLWRLTLSS